MGRNAMVLREVAVAIGVTTLVLIVAAHEDVRTLRFGYTAHRNNTGLWEFLVKTGGNASFQQAHFDVEMMVRESRESNHPKDGRWVEIISKVKNHKLDDDEDVALVYTKSVPKEKAWPPPPGYTNMAGLGYYKVHRDMVPWETARRRCVAEGAHLLVLNSALEAAVLVAANEFYGWVWLGFDDFDVEGEYITVHGTTLEEAGYTRWAPREPTSDFRCGVANADGLLGTGNCELERNYVCEFHSPNEHVLEQRVPGVPVGYHAAGALGFYRVRRDRVKWETARRRCAADGAHLMVPNTAEEAAAVLRTSELPDWFWLGFDDFRNHHQYINFNGQQLKTEGVYSNFADGEPDEDVHCGVGRVSSHLGTGNCDLLRKYICELNKPDEVPDRQPPSSSTPPLGYAHLTNSSYYKVHRDKASWETARRRCADEGAHLLIVNSQEEADAVLKTSGLPSWLWLGFDDFVAAGEYVYLDGTHLTDTGYVPWKSKEPTENLNCGVALANGLLGTGNCRIEREYICEWEEPSIPIPQSPYPAGYLPMGGLGVYKMHRDLLRWEAARRRCAAEGAHLLVINSQAEADAVIKANSVRTWSWVGFDDYNRYGEYVTVLGTTLEQAGYSRWARGEPVRDLRCGVTSADGLLGTSPCNVDREFICELRR